MKKRIRKDKMIFFSNFEKNIKEALFRKERKEVFQWRGWVIF